MAVRAELPGITDVPRGVVRLANGLEVTVHGLFCCRFVIERKGKGVPVEFAALGLEQPLPLPGE